jgi:hypothetical protein
MFLELHLQSMHHRLQQMCSQLQLQRQEPNMYPMHSLPRMMDTRAQHMMKTQSTLL